MNRYTARVIKRLWSWFEHWRDNYRNEMLRFHPIDGPKHVCTLIVQWRPIELCGKPAVRHMRFELPEHGHSFGSLCAEHVGQDVGPWEVLQSHPYSVNCGMPGSGWDIVQNVCVVPDDFLQPVVDDFNNTSAAA